MSTKVLQIDMAKHNALSNILESSNIKPVNEILNLEEVNLSGVISGVISGVRSLLLESDSNKMIDDEASKIKFKNIDGDQDNSFEEGKDDDTIYDKLDDNGNYHGKGKTTIYDKKIDLEDESKSKQRWVETATGKVSDGETEEVPNPQGVDNLNESGLDLHPVGEGPSDEELKAHGMTRDQLEKAPMPNINDHLNKNSIYNKQTSGAIKNLFANVQPKR